MRLRLVVIAQLAACAAAGPIPTGDKPSWVQWPATDPRYPADKYIAAVGTANLAGKQPAELLALVDASARAAIAAQLTASVSSEVTSFESARTVNGRTEERQSAEARTKQVVADFDLAAAVGIEGRWREQDTGYAWAVLDKQKALALQQGKIADHEKLAHDLLAQAETSAPADALKHIARARTEGEAALNGMLLLRALGGKAEITSTVSQAEAKMTEALSKFVISVLEGDKQRVADGKALALPVVISVWLAGKPAAGLPMIATVAGGRAANDLTVGADGKLTVRVDDVGKFTQAEQQIAVSLDWARLLGLSSAPAWTAAAPKVGATAVAIHRSVQTTRVMVLVQEKVEGGSAVSEPPVTAAITQALQASGFDVQNSKEFAARLRGEKAAGLTDAQLKLEAKELADVVITGSVVSRESSKFGAETVWARARADVRAVDLATGQVLWQAPADEVKSERPGKLDVAGRSSLEALSRSLAPAVDAALRKAVQ